MIGYESKKPPTFAEGFMRDVWYLLSSDPGETRTHDQWLKRPLLYQLSYRIKIFNLYQNLVEKSIIENHLKKSPFKKILFY